MASAYDKLLKQFGPLVAKSYRRVINTVKRAVDENALIAAIDRFDISGMVDAIGMTEAQIFPFTEAVRSTYVGAGMSVGENVKGGSFGFSALQPRAMRWIDQTTARLVQGIQDQSRDMVTDVVRRGVEDGRSSAAMARDIVGNGRDRVGSRIGITTQQSQYVDNARGDLEDLSKHYFTRAQRDKRFDKMVRKAIEKEKPLSRKQISKITGRYAEKFEKYRATDIARSETRAAVASGQAEGYFQLLDDPEVEKVTVRWQYNVGDQETEREDHRRIGGEIHALGDAWIMDDGTPMQYPHDPNGGPAQNSHCHCSPFFRVTLRV